MNVIQKAEEVKAVLLPMIVGKAVEEQSCNCGAIHIEEGVAIGIFYPTMYRDSQAAEYYLWSVDVVGKKTGQQYSVGLSYFVDRDKIKEIFDQHFSCFDFYKPWSEEQ